MLPSVIASSASARCARRKPEAVSGGTLEGPARLLPLPRNLFAPPAVVRSQRADGGGRVARAGSRSVRDCLVWAFIIGGHALLILVFTGTNKRQALPALADLPSPSVLILLDEPTQASAADPAADAPSFA